MKQNDRVLVLGEAIKTAVGWLDNQGSGVQPERVNDRVYYPATVTDAQQSPEILTVQFGNTAPHLVDIVPLAQQEEIAVVAGKSVDGIEVKYPRGQHPTVRGVVAQAVIGG